MSGHSHRTPKPNVQRKEAKANFAWRSVSSDEAFSRTKLQFKAESAGLYDSDRGPEDWGVLLDDSDDSASAWGQNSSSSSASWSDDLESEATSRLQQQLDVLDKIVFGEDLTPEEKSIHIPGDLLEEATLWRTSYPHLRVEGVTLTVPPTQENFEYEEEILESHGVIDDDIQQPNESARSTNLRVGVKNDDSCEDAETKSSTELKADVMKKLFDFLWPEVRECVKSKLLSYPGETVEKSNKQLPVLDNQQYRTSTPIYQNPQSFKQERKHSSNNLEIPVKHNYGRNNQITRDQVALDSILKVSPLAHKHSANGYETHDINRRSYQILSSRGQIHLTNNRNHHLTLPPIEIPNEPVRGNSLEGSLLHLRSTSALSHENRQLSSSRPNTSTLTSGNENLSKSSYIAVSPSNLTKKLSFNVLGKHLPANPSLTSCRSNQKKLNNVHR